MKETGYCIKCRKKLNRLDRKECQYLGWYECWCTVHLWEEKVFEFEKALAKLEN